MSRSVIFRFSSLGVLTFSAALFGGRSNSYAAPAGLNDYHQVRSFTLPVDNNPSSAGTLYSSLSNGAFLALNETQILQETSVASGTFTPVGSLPASFSPSFGPSFLAISPDGTTAAAGDQGGHIAVFNPSSPSSAAIDTLSDDFDGTWFSNNQLAITNSNGVQILNTTSKAVTTVVSDIGGASAGITFDSAGNLYTGDGFYFGTGANQTGLIKEFSKASWQSALSSGTPLDFQASGTLVAQLLSAASLGFDSSGNFFVGGADFFSGTGNFGYNALVSAAAIQSAIALPPTIGLITGSSPPSVLRQFDSPADDISNFDSGFWTYNNATGDLDLRYFGDTNVQVFSAVPEPGSISLLSVSTAVLMLRRRRRTRAAVIALTAVGACVTTAATSRPAQAGYIYNPNDLATTLISSTVPASTSPLLRSHRNSRTAAFGLQQFRKSQCAAKRNG